MPAGAAGPSSPEGQGRGTSRGQGRLHHRRGTGAGRTHAVRLAQEGADIIAVDIDEQVETSFCPTATAADLEETVSLVEELDRRIVARTADVRDLAALQAVVAEGVAELGRLDIVCANAGIASCGTLWELDEHTYQDMIDINLTGVWKTIRATVPVLVDQGSGESVILTSSVAGLQAYANLGHYVAAKHGVTGLMRSLAVEGAPHNIRCNSVHPTTVDTPMINNPAGWELFTGGVQGATRADMEGTLLYMNALRVPWVQAEDISNMVLFLASDESRYVTGTAQLVDAGTTFPFKIPPG